jgi:alpha-amylase
MGNSGYYYGFFWEGMPDLNFHNPEVTGFMENVVSFWLDEVGVDGFRVDAAKHLIEEGDQRENTPATHEWYRDFYRSYKANFPDAYTVGEVFGAGSSVVKSYTGDQLDQVFNFEMSSWDGQ